jgi:hypothetical protein
MMKGRKCEPPMSGARHRRRQEAAIQRAVFQHLRARAAPGVFAFHVPNGGYRKPVEAAIMKGLGVVAGVPTCSCSDPARARTAAARGSKVSRWN